MRTKFMKFALVLIAIVLSLVPLVSAQAASTLTINNDEPAPGEPVVVTWSMPADSVSADDHIGVFRPEKPNYKPLVSRPTGAIATGTMEFMFAGIGDYEVRFLNGRNALLAKVSVEVQYPDIVKRDAYMVTATPNLVTPGSEVTVAWSVKTTDTIKSDWIAIYKRGEMSNRKYIDWMYTKSKSGTAKFTFKKVGLYEIRYLKNNKYKAVAISNLIVVVSPELIEKYAGEHGLF